MCNETALLAHTELGTYHQPQVPSRWATTLPVSPSLSRCILWDQALTLLWQMVRNLKMA